MIFLDIAGDLTSGITIHFEVSDDSLNKCSCSLPKNIPLLDGLVKRNSYYGDSPNYRTLKNGKPFSISIEDVKANEEKLISTFRDWLDSSKSLQLRDKIKTYGSQEKELPKVFIRCQDEYIHSCPWEELLIFKIKGIKAEVSLSPFEPIHRHEIIPDKERVKSKILVVIGCKDGIELDESIEKLDKFAEREDVNIVQLIDCTTTEIADFIKEFKPKIFIYLGHSQGYDMGFHNVNDLENTFEKAVQNGLQIAIINSCSGIQIALQLLRFGLPFVVAMRWAIHDDVANRFHNTFLDELIIKKKTIPLAYREAKDNLQSKQGDYPSASLIPALFQIRPDLRLPRKRKLLTQVITIMLSGVFILSAYLYLNQNKSSIPIIKNDDSQSSAKVLKDVFQNTEKSVVQIRQEKHNQLYSSGFVFYKSIDNNTYYVLTTNPKTRDFGEVTIKIDGETSYPAYLINNPISRAKDVVIYKFCAGKDKAKPLELADSSEISGGLDLYIVGLISDKGESSYSYLSTRVANVGNGRATISYPLRTRKTMNGSPIVSETGLLVGMHSRSEWLDNTEIAKDDGFRFAEGISVVILQEILSELKKSDLEKSKSCP